jgi:hypothetical protein
MERGHPITIGLAAIAGAVPKMSVMEQISDSITISLLTFILYLLCNGRVVDGTKINYGTNLL